MSNPPPLKSIPGSRPAADVTDGRPKREAGAPKGVGRQAVPSALRAEVAGSTGSGDGRVPLAWLHITAPKGAVPTATSTCACGRDRSAVGHRKALALIEDHTTHRTTCPLLNPTEGRAAA